LWKEIFDSKYSGWRSLTKGGKFSKGSLWWKDLKEVWDSEDWGRSFEDGFKWKVGDGKEISFWEDIWLSCGTLKGVFPRLLSLSSAKNAKIVELGYWYNGEWVWNLDWRRSFFDWEKSLVEQLFQILQEVKLVFGEADSWVWKIEESQTFSVNSAYVQVRGVRGGGYSPVYSKLWRCKVLPSTLFTAWRLLENRIASRVNLVRRGVAVENPLCCLCGEEEESLCHLFFFLQVCLACLVYVL